MEEELSPEQAERVRRLLADARHTESMPADVAARLDRVLAELVTVPQDEEQETQGRAAVVPLAQRRRRAGRLLLAAAAVVVGGVAVAQIGSSGGGETALDAGGDAGRALQAPERESADLDVPPASSDPGPGAVADTQVSIARGPARVVRPSHFVRDARRARSSAVRVTLQSQTDGQESLRDVVGCEPEAWGGGRYVPVSYGRTGGWLVVRAPVGDTQVADLFLCGDESAVRSATLPFR